MRWEMWIELGLIKIYINMYIYNQDIMAKPNQFAVGYLTGTVHALFTTLKNKCTLYNVIMFFDYVKKIKILYR